MVKVTARCPDLALERVASAWLEGSRIILDSRQPRGRAQMVRREFASHGNRSETRLELVLRGPTSEWHMKLYNRLDIRP